MSPKQIAYVAFVESILQMEKMIMFQNVQH